MSAFVISTSSFDIDNNPAIQHLLQKGMRAIPNPYRRKLTEDEIIGLLDSGAVGLIAGIEPLTERVFNSSQNLKIISRCGTGLDSVDLTAAKNHGITVLNTPEAPAQAVAELTMGMILASLRQIRQIDQSVRRGEWPRIQGRLLGAQIVGIIGMGFIGRRVAGLCRTFGATVIAHDPYASQIPVDIELMNLKQVLTTADIISLHTSYTPETHHILDAHAFSLIKPGSIVINAARGGLIDESALLAALQSGQISAVALDVFEQEPYYGSLIKYDNAILTSHIGSLARESRQQMEIEAAENLLQGLIRIGLIND